MEPIAPSVFTIPAGSAFSRTLAEGVVARIGGDPLALADVSILVPTRRAVRTLHEVFAQEFGGAALGPQIRALGDLGEDDIAFDPSADDLDLWPAMASLRRQLLLARLVDAKSKSRGLPIPFAHALAHAHELGQFLDEATAQGADLNALENLAPAALAAHWQDVLLFLGVIAEEWPKLLAANACLEAAARRDMILRRHGERLAASLPRTLVIAAGSTGSIPATAELLKVIALLPAGAVVLPALDTNLDQQSWDNLDPAHAQFGLRQLLRHIGVARDEVQSWTKTGPTPAAQSQRNRFLSEALRPPPTTDAWRDLAEHEKPAFVEALDGLALIEASNPSEEALVVAIALREALETPGRRAALVTPDRGLARRVAAELSRWDIVIDDSAGTTLSRTPPGAYLALLAHAANEGFSPVPLLCLLKHPLAAGGGARAIFRAHARALEELVLRGLRPAPGLSGIAEALRRNNAAPELQHWFAELARILAPLAAAMERDDIMLADAVRLHAAAAEALAANDAQDGANILWRGEAGEAAALLVSELVEHGGDIPIAQADRYANLFQELAEARIVRPRFGAHPRVAILGSLEARLQHYDLVILGALNEGVWPAEATTDPWLSRPMRNALGLEAPERRIGLAAHDFASLAASPEVLLTRSLKQDGAPTSASRWLLRVRQLAKGLGLEEKLWARRELLDWARNLDRPARMVRSPRPAPRPPVSVRPRTLGVTEIETWLRDPYAIYARHVLRLKPLDPIDAEPGPRERGTAIHRALEHFLLAYPDALPAHAIDDLIRFGDEAFVAAGASSAAIALWRPRFLRAARWFLIYETERRKTIVRALVEKSGRLTIAAPKGPFTLRGRADRIDLFADGAAAILDYKSGRAPTQKQMAALLKPQLPLEAAMLLQGAFPGIKPTHIRELVHVCLSGAETPGDAIAFQGDATLKAQEALLRLTDLIALYDDESQPYRSREIVERLTDSGDYDHLARVREWSLIGENEV